MPLSRPYFETIARVGFDVARDRLARRVRRGAEHECWPTTSFGARPYGVIQIGGVKLLAHRVAWIAENRRDPGERLVCHSCDNPPCCNPAHLFLGTYRDNYADMVAKGRRVTHAAKRSRRRGPAISREQAEAIRADKRPRDVIAAEFGVTVSHVSKIRCGSVWGDEYIGTRRPKGPRASEDYPQAKLTREQARAIYLDARSNSAISREYGIERSAVRQIKKRKTWRTATADLADCPQVQQSTPDTEHLHSPGDRS